MSLPQDLKFNPSEPDKNNEYIFVDISPLDVGTPYKFQFKWVFADKKINDLLEDHSSKGWSATYDYISKSAAAPKAVTNLTGTWLESDGSKKNTLYVKFNHDLSLNDGTNNNTAVDRYLIRLTTIGASPITKDFYLTDINKSSSAQVWSLTRLENKQWFGGFFRNQFTITVIAIDSTNKLESAPTTITSEIAPQPLNAPTITVTPGNFEYYVSWNDQDGSILESIYIEEVVSNSLTPPSTGWSFKKKGYKDNPVTVPATVERRWVRAYFISTEGQQTDYSNAVAVTPTDPIANNADQLPPCIPIVTAGTPTSNSIPITINTECPDDTKAFMLRYKKSTDVVYTTTRVEIAGSSTSTTILGLKGSTQYNISAAAYDAANNLSDYGSDINATTLAQTVNKPTGQNLTATSSGVLATWIAPTVQPLPIEKYKVELWKDNASPAVDELLLTEFTFSTNHSFGGLAAGDYYVRITSQDIDGNLDDEYVQTNTVSVTGVAPTDGLVPLFSPAAVVNPLYAALEVKWTGLNTGVDQPRSTTSNPDPIIYEVHLSTTNNFTPSASTLALQTAGTFAIIKTLPGTSTPLSYGNTYYIKILSKDADGPASSYGTQGSSMTSQIDNGDIAANAIRANVIRAGEITADQINSGALLANKIITVGARSAVVTAASVSGGNITYTTSGAHSFSVGTVATVTGMTNSNFNITNFAIQSVTSNTFTVVVGGSGATGSISNQSGAASATSTNAIKIDASGLGTTASPFKLYSGTGTHKNNSTPFYLDTNGQFSLSNLFWVDNGNLKVTGEIEASSGNFSGAMTINNGTMKFGKGVNAVNVPVNGQSAGSLDGIYIDTNNYWFQNGIFSVGALNNTVKWNGTSLSVTGEINAFSGKIAGNFQIEPAGTLYIGGLLNTPGVTPAVPNTMNRILINTSGISAYPANSNIANFAILTDGSATLKKGTIAEWQIFDNYIEKNGIRLDTVSRYIAVSTTLSSLAYSTGITVPSTTTDIVLWAGQTDFANRSSATFRVNAAGVMTATNANLTGTLTAGATSWVRVGPNADGGTAGNNGIFVSGSNDYIYGNGNFRLGNGRLTYVNSTSTLTFDASTASIVMSEMPQSDYDNWGGDATVTVRDNDGRLVKGRRFIYDSSLSAASTPVNPSTSTTDTGNNTWWNNTTKLGEYFVGGVQRPVKTGDILIVAET